MITTHPLHRIADSAKIGLQSKVTKAKFNIAADGTLAAADPADDITPAELQLIRAGIAMGVFEVLPVTPVESVAGTRPSIPRGGPDA